jgi:polar amino acid transport system permease protein
MFRAAVNESSRLAALPPLFWAGLFYFLMNLIVEQVFRFTERKLDYYK